MTYATLPDLIERAGEKEILQVADRDRDGIPDPDVIAAAIRDGMNVVNGYVATKYRVPFGSVPDLVRTWTVSIARYTLHRNTPPTHVRDDYDDAIAALKDVAAGRNVLPVEEGEEPPTAVAGKVIAAHPPQVFTAHKLRGWGS